MDTSLSSRAGPPIGDETLPAISWSAVIAGAVTSIAVALLLGALAAGFGFKLAAPWPNGGGVNPDFTPILGAALVAVQAISSGFGGYIAGRLRHRWTNLHEHEAHFRDTAHGFLSWAVSTLAGVLLVAAVAPGPARMGVAALAQADPVRGANIAAQMSLFMAVGLLLAAFMASVAAAIGGLRREEMHALLRR